VEKKSWPDQVRQPSRPGTFLSTSEIFPAPRFLLFWQEVARKAAPPQTGRPRVRRFLWPAASAPNFCSCNGKKIKKKILNFFYLSGSGIPGAQHLEKTWPGPAAQPFGRNVFRASNSRNPVRYSLSGLAAGRAAMRISWLRNFSKTSARYYRALLPCKVNDPIFSLMACFTRFVTGSPPPRIRPYSSHRPFHSGTRLPP